MWAPITKSKSTFKLVTSITGDNGYLSSIRHISFDLDLCLLMCFHVTLVFELLQTVHVIESVFRLPKCFRWKLYFSNLWKVPLVSKSRLNHLHLFIHITYLIFMSKRWAKNLRLTDSLQKNVIFRSYLQHGRKMAFFSKYYSNYYEYIIPVLTTSA